MDSLFFLASKLIWLLIRPESWLAGTFLIGILALWAGRMRAAKVVLTTALLALVTIGIFPLGLILIARWKPVISPPRRSMRLPA